MNELYGLEASLRKEIDRLVDDMRLGNPYSTDAFSWGGDSRFFDSCLPKREHSISRWSRFPRSMSFGRLREETLND
ncbi:hypothetical protein PBI_GAIA_97 [Mycobacterium phage Gaia]|uniref:Uncharacterized protein n=1 Tax=Mycobacterium phage Gaia TaxID=1486472 RepID=A0A068F4M9_9CAUD|nr:hypothetical protein VC46_gp136 [Mycobacterium phage Gaia]AID58916.1 hypothetical protein PBI_GAIA_97 [Mycobacterium phage Gaia]